jgi:hypothetical protein
VPGAAIFSENNNSKQLSFYNVLSVFDAATFNGKGSRSEKNNKETRKQGS